jgi:hypothetical protein
LIRREAVRQQQAQAGTECATGASDQHEFLNGDSSFSHCSFSEYDERGNNSPIFE